MPTPVSLTRTSSRSPTTRAATVTVPPLGVNFTALDSRLSRICLKRRGSACQSPTSGATSVTSARPCRRQRSRTSVVAFEMAAATLKSLGSGSSRPASIFDRSRMSLISVSG